MQHLLWGFVDAPRPAPELFDVWQQRLDHLGQAQVSHMLANNLFRLSGRDQRGSEYTDRTLRHRDGTGKAAFNNTVACEQWMTDWAQQNISASAIDMRFTHTTPGRDRLGPHCDMTRSYVLVWLIQSGGQQHRTVFYRQISTGILQGGANYHVDDYSDLEELGSLQVPLHRWTLLNATILHSVENITQGRVALHVSLGSLPDLPLTDPEYVFG